MFEREIESVSQAVTFEHRSKLKVGSVAPCANKKVVSFKRAEFSEKVVCLVGEIGILVF